ncbi:aldo/keto reductase [Citricoccus sp. NPDC055426]|uniref:aldo/keto reductase n=1 Tax=Citricoccus sp. NPDC055426 TaxID=3155536 RepID=UPI00343AB1E4
MITQQPWPPVQLRSLVMREEEREMFSLLDYQKAGSIPYSPLAKGRLARPWGERTYRTKTDVPGRRFDIEEDKPIIDAVEKVASSRGVSMASVALAWVLTNPAVDAPIVGASKWHHLADAAAALEIDLTDDELEVLTEPYRPHEPTNLVGPAEALTTR